MERLIRIVDAIKRESAGAQARLLLARVGLKAGVNVNNISEKTADNPALEAKLLKAAKEILGKELLIIQSKLEELNKLENEKSA